MTESGRRWVRAIDQIWMLCSGVDLRGQLLRGGAGSLLAKLAEIALGVVLAAVLARLLGVDGYGVYVFVFALISLVSVPVRLGLPPLVVRETARGQVEGEWARVRGAWRWANAVILLLSLATVAVGLAGLWLGWTKGEMLRATLFWGLLLIPLQALAAIQTASLRGLRRVLAGLIPEQIFRPTALIVFLLTAAMLPFGSLSPADTMLLAVVAAGLAFSVGVWLLRRYRPAGLSEVAPVYHHRTWLAAAWPLALTQGFQQINRYVDVLLLGILATVADVGVYRVAAQGALLVAMGLTALNMATAPYITRLHAQGDTAKLQKLAKGTAQAALTFALPMVLLFAVLGEWLLSVVFGPDYATAYAPLLILSTGQLANVAFGATGLLLNMTGFEREVTRAVATAAGVNVLLNLALIPPLGVSGAAIATATTLVFWNAWLWRQVSLRLGVRSSVI